MGQTQFPMVGLGVWRHCLLRGQKDLVALGIFWLGFCVMREVSSYKYVVEPQMSEKKVWIVVDAVLWGPDKIAILGWSHCALL